MVTLLLVQFANLTQISSILFVIICVYYIQFLSSEYVHLSTTPVKIVNSSNATRIFHVALLLP